MEPRVLPRRRCLAAAQGSPVAIWRVVDGELLVDPDLAVSIDEVHASPDGRTVAVRLGRRVALVDLPTGEVVEVEGWFAPDAELHASEGVFRLRSRRDGSAWITAAGEVLSSQAPPWSVDAAVRIDDQLATPVPDPRAERTRLVR